MTILHRNDYVLATKYHDGDPCDHFAVGFLREVWTRGDCVRYGVEDSDGKLFRANGFRRCEKISESIGNLLVDAIPVIGNVPGKSIWYWRYHPDQLRRLLGD